MFNPFSVPFTEIGCNDLDVLKTVSEGWYVEYKEQMPANAAIGKSVAAFANCRSGWLFIGIVEDKATQTAQDICGIETDPKIVVETIFRVVNSHVTPCPFFSVRPVKLPSGRFVIVIHVPESEDTPHITRDGRVYVRAGNCSDPVPESRVDALHSLHDRSTERATRVRSFLEDDYPCNAHGHPSSKPLLTFAVVPSSSSHAELDCSALHRKAGEECRLPVRFGYGELTVPITNIISSASRVIAREAPQGAYTDLAYTLEFHTNGSLRVSVPLTAVDPSADWAESEYSRAMSWIGEHSPSREHQSPPREYSLFAVYPLFLAIVHALRMYSNVILESNPVPPQLCVAARLQNVWHHVPLAFGDEYVRFLKLFGIPYVLRRQVDVPDSLGGNPFYVQSAQAFRNTDAANELMSRVLEATGIPRYASAEIVPRDLSVAFGASGKVTL